MRNSIFPTFIIIFFLNINAYSVCSTPAGIAGQLSLVGGLVNYCDGSAWQDPAVAVQLGCTAGEVGELQYLAGDAQVCDGSFWYSIRGSVGEPCTLAEIGTLAWRGPYKKMQYCDGYDWYTPYAAATPTITSLDINSGAATTSNNYVQTDLSANVVDSQSVLTEFCYKFSAGTGVPTAPLHGDSCWQSYNAASPGLTPAASLSFTGHYYLLGFTEATYDVYAWVKTSAGQISTLSNAGNGTDGVDKKTIEYQPNPPPSLINVLSANSDSADFPLDSSETTSTLGTTVYIKWKASATSGFGATPISIYYTEDESSYTLVASNVTNAANAGCTVDGSTFTGCYTWTSGSPSSSYFRIRIVAEDDIGIKAISSGPGMNTSAFNVLAGNTDPGLGGSAASAVIFNNTGASVVDIEGKSFVVTSDGTFYIRDNRRGILKMDPTTGLLTQYIAYTGSHTDGPVGTASLRSNHARLTLDYNEDIIVHDYDRIKKIDLTAGTITTIIGGGATNADATNALDFSMGSCHSQRGYSCPLNVLPNGDIYFLRRNSHSATPASGEAIWHYKASDDKVYSLIPSGTGTEQEPTRDIANSRLAGFLFAFDPVTSAIDNFFGLFQRQPCSGCGPHQESAELDQSTWASLGTGFPIAGGHYYAQLTSMNGDLYVVSQRRYIHKYDPLTNSWTKILGSGTTGTCVDGTPAVSCDVYARDGFVTAQGNVYFLDNGQMRTIDASGNVVTLFGQKFSFGDGGLATSARFGGVYAIDESSSGKISVLDYVENNLREFTVGGNISKLIGNSQPSGATSGNPGATEPIMGTGSHFFYDDATEDIYYVVDSKVFRYDRATGNTMVEFGQGGNDFSTADGLVGSSIQIGGYSEKLHGYNGTHILAGSNYWNGTAHERGYLKLYDKGDSWRQSSLAGNSGLVSGSFPADGSTLATSTIPRPHQGFMVSHWDSATSTWHFKEGNKIRTLPVGGAIGTLVTLPRSITAGWTMVKNASMEWVIYYCSGSRVYKYNATTLTETTLAWPSSTISCGGGTLNYSSSRNSVVFPFTQNNMWAIGEILDTP